MVFVKKSNFLSSVFFFWVNQARKDHFGLLDKKECPLKQKKDIFPRGWSMVFVKKSNSPSFIKHYFKFSDL